MVNVPISFIAAMLANGVPTAILTEAAADTPGTLN
jgi:hypothetical protein